jgi:hypothetical protein
MSKPDPQALAAAMEGVALLMNHIAKHASDIAHARRVLFEAYIAEGFTEAQALELCKVLNLS